MTLHAPAWYDCVSGLTLMTTWTLFVESCIALWVSAILQFLTVNFKIYEFNPTNTAQLNIQSHGVLGFWGFGAWSVGH